MFRIISTTVLLVLIQNCTAGFWHDWLGIGEDSSEKVNLEDADFQGRIIGGKPISIEDIPFQVSLYHTIKEEHFCGGAMISETCAVTAAHCYVTYDFKIRAGSSDRTKGGFWIEYDEVLSHDEFTSYYMDYDIAILKLKPWNSGNFNMEYATLPALTRFENGTISSYEQPDLEVGEYCDVSGWGVNRIEDPEKANMLQTVKVPIVDRKHCKEVLKDDNEVTEHMFCGGYKEGAKDSCQGDSGGPILCGDDSILTGVVSWGVGCAKADIPGVYTNFNNPEIRKYIYENCGV